MILAMSILFIAVLELIVFYEYTMRKCIYHLATRENLRISLFTFDLHFIIMIIFLLIKNIQYDIKFNTKKKSHIYQAYMKK